MSPGVCVLHASFRSTFLFECRDQMLLRAYRLIATLFMPVHVELMPLGSQLRSCIK